MKCVAFQIRSARQRGFTLVELMVAMVLGLLVAAAGVAALIIGRQGFASVDSATQLRETARFAASTLDQAGAQVGFVNVAYSMFTNNAATLRGYDNSLVSPGFASLPLGLAHNTRPANCGSATGTACLNNSDVLVVNFWGASRNGQADGSMVDCGGVAEPEGTASTPGAYSIFSVATGGAGEVNAEPALVCTYHDPAPGGLWHTVPIVQGVESFKVLYGVYGLTKGTCAPQVATPAQAATAVSNGQTPTETYFTAEDMDAPAGVFCPTNWTYVRNLRIGLLVRGPVGSAQVSATKTWNILQSSKEQLFNNAATLTTAADGRLRQQLVFTVHVHNAL
jgi:type IV pilus assembly protein PilW